MSVYEILKKLDLLCWNSLFFGLKNGWISRKEVIDYAVNFMMSSTQNDTIILIAGGEYDEESEFEDYVFNAIDKINESVALDKLRLAFLISIDESDVEEAIKINKLQDVYADFGYPEDMSKCSIYSPSKGCPLNHMVDVIKELHHRITSIIK